VKDLFQSGYEGVISEVGIGVPLQAEILSYAGASDFLLMGMTPYNQAFQPKIRDRAVSEDMSIRMAQAIFNQAKASGFPRSGKKLFSVAVTGTHTKSKTGGQTHAWMCIMTDANIFIVHFYMRPGVNRRGAISWARRQTLNILQDALLNKSPEGDRWGTEIDVIRWPGLSTEEKLKTYLSQTNPLYFDSKGHMQRATDMIRNAKAIYRGSFNPVTQSHLEIGKDALFELSMTNFRKPASNYTDLVHRINMLNIAGKGVLVTTGQETFIAFQEMLYKKYKIKSPYVMGMDTFNAVVEHGITLADKSLGEAIHPNILLMNFIVNQRGKTAIHPMSSSLKVEYVQRGDEYSSTQARTGDHSKLPPGVSDYINKNKLYV